MTASFAERLQQIKAERGYTLAQMARRCQVSWPTMQRWVRGKTQPHLLSQVSAIQALQVPRWKCICTGQGGGVYSGECPIHDPSVDTSSLHWRKSYDDHLEAQRRIRERLGW